MGRKVLQDDAVADRSRELDTDAGVDESRPAGTGGVDHPGPDSDGDRPLQDGRETASKQALTDVSMGTIAPNTSNLPTSPHLVGSAAVEAKLAYLEHLREHRIVSLAMEAAGITFQQLKRFRAEDPAFVSGEEEAALFDDDKLRKRLNDGIDDGDTRILVPAMKRLPEYNPAKETNVNVSGSVEHRHLKDMSQEEKRNLIAEAAAIDVEFEEVE